MTTRTMRTLTWVAGFAWLVVAGVGLRSAIVDDDADWELIYFVFSLALLVGAALSVTVAAWVTRQGGRPRLRLVGLVVSSLGAVASLVAWAYPLWMTLLGVGFALVTVAAGPRERRAVALLAAGQLAGLAVMIAAIEAEIGRRDEWGDYPLASGIAVGVMAAMTLVALFKLTGSLGGRPVMLGSAGLPLGASGIE